LNDYWKQYFNTKSIQHNNSLLNQVGKTVNGKVISIKQVDLIVSHISSILDLKSTDSLIDLCCGNGLITKRLSPLVKDISGIDYSEGLINAAQSFSQSENIKYINSDILDLDRQYLSRFNKVLLYEGLQHLSEVQLSKLLDLLNGISNQSLIFLGSIPDKSKLKVYYDTDEKYDYYLKCEEANHPHMGKWWFVEDIIRTSINRGFKVTVIPQPATLYSSYYRYDALLEKCS